jgi:hypothetical protein
MSGFAAARPARRSPLSYVALALALAAVVAWVLAGMLDDGLYVVTGALAIAAFAVGGKAWRDAKQVGFPRRSALAAMIVGGLLGAAFIVYTVVWAISEAF